MHSLPDTAACHHTDMGAPATLPLPPSSHRCCFRRACLCGSWCTRASSTRRGGACRRAAGRPPCITASRCLTATAASRRSSRRRTSCGRCTPTRTNCRAASACASWTSLVCATPSRFDADCARHPLARFPAARVAGANGCVAQDHCQRTKDIDVHLHHLQQSRCLHSTNTPPPRRHGRSPAAAQLDAPSPATPELRVRLLRVAANKHGVSALVMLQLKYTLLIPLHRARLDTAAVSRFPLSS